MISNTLIKLIKESTNKTCENLAKTEEFAKLEEKYKRLRQQYLDRERDKTA